MAEHVLRVLREDGDDAVLINVRAPAKEGGEMIIEGTEGEIPYVGKCMFVFSSLQPTCISFPVRIYLRPSVHLPISREDFKCDVCSKLGILVPKFYSLKVIHPD
jgi:hypothetical protein